MPPWIFVPWGRSSKLFYSHYSGGKTHFCLTHHVKMDREDNPSARLEPFRNLMGSCNSFGKGKRRRKPLHSSNPAAAKLCEIEITTLSWLVVWHGCRDDWKGLWIVLSWVICAPYSFVRGATLCCRTPSVCCRTCTATLSPKIEVNNPLSNTALI